MKKVFFEVSISKIYIFAFLYLLLPVALTIGFWFRWYYAVPSLALICYASYKACIQIHNATATDSSVKVDLEMTAILLIILIWLMAIGIGGFIGQNHLDHSYRNAVLYELVQKSWPVTETVDGQEYYLSYYFTFWIPAAIIGKLFHSMTAAYLGLLICSWIWIALTAIMVMHFCGCKRNLLITILLLFFIPPVIINKVIFHDILKWYLYDFVHPDPFGSPTMPNNCFLIYNQTLPIVMAIPLMIRMGKSPESVAMVLSMIFYYGPLETLPIIPVVAILVFRNIGCFNTWEMWAAIIMATLISVFYIGNSSGMQMQGIWQNVYSFEQVIIMLIAYVTVSIAVFLPFIWNLINHNIYFWTLLISTILICFVKPTYGDFDPNGGNFDYGWKSPTALMFVLYMGIAYVCSHITWMHHRIKCITLGLILMTGFISGYKFHYDMVRHLASCINPTRYPIIERDEKRNGKLFRYDKEDPISCAVAGNFITPVPTIYSKYLMPVCSK